MLVIKDRDFPLDPNCRIFQHVISALEFHFQEVINDEDKMTQPFHKYRIKMIFRRALSLETH